MSANLDLVRSLYVAWERGDYGSTEWAHAEIELVAASDGPDPGCWTGHAEITHAWRDYLRAWEDHRSEAEEYREIDDERILVLIKVSGRGKLDPLIPTADQIAEPRNRRIEIWVR